MQSKIQIYATLTVLSYFPWHEAFALQQLNESQRTLTRNKINGVFRDKRNFSLNLNRLAPDSLRHLDSLEIGTTVKLMFMLREDDRH